MLPSAFNIHCGCSHTSLNAHRRMRCRAAGPPCFRWVGAIAPRVCCGDSDAHLIVFRLCGTHSIGACYENSDRLHVLPIAGWAKGNVEARATHPNLPAPPTQQVLRSCAGDARLRSSLGTVWEPYGNVAFDGRKSFGCGQQTAHAAATSGWGRRKLPVALTRSSSTTSAPVVVPFPADPRSAFGVCPGCSVPVWKTSKTIRRKILVEELRVT